LLVLVGVLWWRVRELEKTVNSLRIQPVLNSSVVWQNEQKSKDKTENNNVFKLLDSTPVDQGKSKVGVPWDVERAMIPSGSSPALPRTIIQGGETTPPPKVDRQDLRLSPKQSDSK
jgi:hypothetical protein